MLTSFTTPEVVKHGQINEGKGHQRAKVNQRRGGHQIKKQGRQRHNPDHDDVQRGSTPFGMDITKVLLREDVIAAHHVQQARNAGMRCQT